MVRIDSKVVETEVMLFLEKRKQVVLGEFFSSIYTKLQPMRTEFPKRVMFSRKSDVFSRKGNVLIVKLPKKESTHRKSNITIRNK